MAEPVGSDAFLRADNDWRRVFAGVVALVALVVVALVSFDAAYARAQWPEPGELVGLATRAAALRSLALWDCLFAIAYGSAGVLAFSGFADRRRDGRRVLRVAALAGIAAVAAGAVADIAENLALWWILGAVTDREAHGDLVRVLGIGKWSFLAAAVLTFATQLVRATIDKPFQPQSPDAVPPDATWVPPRDGQPVRRGICLSGGGIRSASFSLGVMQALQDRDQLRSFDYLTAASGGGYLAAGWALSHSQTDATSAGGPWSRGSPEERWFRNHSSYLVPNLREGARGLIRLVAGIVVNVVILWLVVMLVSRPVGWAIHELHPEVHPRALLRDGRAELRIGAVTELPAAADVRRFSVALVPIGDPDARPQRGDAAMGDDGRRRASQVCVDVAPPIDPGPPSQCEDLSVDAAIVSIKAGLAAIERQPRAGPPARAAAFMTPVHPRLALPDPTVETASEIKRAIQIASQPRITWSGDELARPPVRADGWMIASALIPAALGALLAFALMASRTPRTTVWRHLASALGAVGGIAFLVMIVLPWAIVELPHAIAGMVGTVPGLGATDAGGRSYVLPTGGFLAIVAVAVRQFLSSVRTTPETPSKTTGSVVRRALTKVGGAQEKLRWYELSPLKLLAGIAMVVVPVIILLEQLQYSAANGVAGRLVAFAIVREHLPEWAWLPDWARFLMIAVSLLVLRVAVDAQSWSLYPFYKERLSCAYLLERVDGGARARTYEEPVPFHELTPAVEARGPRLVVCCAVNLSRWGDTPPGRRAASFTFAGDYIGGPLTGWVASEDFWRTVPRFHKKDITLPAAMAISGAAFSPAMGKFNLGPTGSIMAMANLRLGVWIPHPMFVAGRLLPAGTTARRQSWLSWAIHRPGWTYFLRELTNSYSFRRRHLYVSDGGHWENLGLVELLRRGCTEIICVNAGGDNQHSFGTIAEAIALAREELGVEIHLDPSALRPPREAAAGGGRELRRTGAKDVAEPLAAASFVVGSFTYRDGTEGKIWLLEPALTADLPFDVHGFAEAEPIFPDDSTGDQVFNHRQFESFRRLGYHQASQLIS